MQAIDMLFEVMPIDLENAEPIEVKAGFKNLYDEFTWQAINFKECFNNSATIVLSKPDAAYCIGFANGVIPVEHAWVRIGEDYYDPTWEKFSEIGQAYKLIRTFNRKELINFLNQSGDYPPELWRMQHLAYLENKND
jgi:hypothetical protein